MSESKRKKVILFLVEGYTDKESLGLILSRLIDTSEVRFQIMAGDVTTSSDPISGIFKRVKAFLLRNRFKKSDILRIVQIIDTDGAFIDPSCVRYSDGKGLKYFDDRIETPAPEAIILRNERKSESAGRLSKQEFIFGIPYSIYYFSVNIEHVLHGVRGGLESADKVRYSRKFVDSFAERPRDFVDFIRSDVVAVRGGYTESWCYIFEGNHSLLRGSNLHLFFDPAQI